MPSTGNLGVPGLPQAPDEQVFKAPPVDFQASHTPDEPIRENAGWMGTGGQVALVADKFLRGWMAGIKERQQRQLNDAANRVAQANDAVYVAGTSVHNLVQAGHDPKDKNDKEMQAAMNALTFAWKQRNDITKQYVMPEGDQGKKKGIGGKIKQRLQGSLTAGHPQLFAQAAISANENIDPMSIYGVLDPKEKEANAEIADREKKRKDQASFEAAAGKDPSQRTEEDKKTIRSYESSYFGKTDVDLTKDDLVRDVQSGKSKSWTQDQKNLARSMGIIGHNAISTFEDNTGMQYLLVTNEDGDVVSKKPLGKKYIPPDQATVAKRVLQGQIDVAAQNIHKAYPDMTDQQVQQLALGSVGILPKGTDFNDASAAQVKSGNAIKALVSEEKDPEKRALLQNFVTQSSDGQWMYRSQAGEGTSHWFGEDTYSGGVPKSKLAAVEGEMRGRLITILMRQNKWSYEQSKKFLDTWSPTISGANASDQGGMGKPPDQSTFFQRHPTIAAATSAVMGSIPGGPGPIPLGMGSTPENLGYVDAYSPDGQLIVSGMTPSEFSDLQKKYPQVVSKPSQQ